MVLLLIAVATLVTAFLFEILPVSIIGKTIFQLQKESLRTLQNRSINEDLKQKILLALSGQVLFSTIKLILFLGVSILPFILLILIENWICDKPNIGEVLISIKGIIFSSSVFLLYFLIKRWYGKFRV